MYEPSGGLRRAFDRARATCLALGAMLAFAACDTLANEMRPANSIEVSVEAQVEVPADVALIDFGVVSQAQTAAAAARENAERMQAVLRAVRGVAGADAQTATGTYSIRPVYEAIRDSGTPRVTGYEVSNVVHLKTKTLARVPEALDAAVRAGANRVQRLAFTLEDDSAPQREALGNAVRNAMQKAETMAAALGVKLGALHSVVEQDVGAVRPLMRQATAMHAESGPLTPIEPGQVQVRARVVVTIQIAR